MEMLLIKEDMYDVIETNPPDPLTEKWKKSDRQCRALINLYIEDNQIIHVKNETTAKATWDKLKNIHERANLSSKLFLLRKLYSLKLQENGDMQKHINNLLELIDKLKAIGEDIKENHIAALLLCSVPDSFNTLITALEARPEVELTSDFIKSKLIDEYNRRIENHTPESKALKSTFGNKNKKDKFCTYCHRNNHYRDQCYHLIKQGTHNPKTNNRHRQN
ncbi:retrotransposon gag domain-containing protein [Lactovum miscens]|uniref:retrotransposon gag domain-containing protein n=1 Tax=Lactovum miscens TaxID=190387 RepID=UPI002ED8C381